VLFVNGIPFGVMECKRSGQPTAEDPLEQAISQQLRESEIPQLFHYTQVLFTLAVNQAKYGATGTPLAFWQGWREQKLPDKALDTLIRTPLSAEEARRTFAPDPHRFNGASPAAARAWLEDCIAQGPNADRAGSAPVRAGKARAATCAR
jgi:hypothetical protein